MRARVDVDVAPTAAPLATARGASTARRGRRRPRGTAAALRRRRARVARGVRRGERGGAAGEPRAERRRAGGGRVERAVSRRRHLSRDVRVLSAHRIDVDRAEDETTERGGVGGDAIGDAVLRGDVDEGAPGRVGVGVGRRARVDEL